MFTTSLSLLERLRDPRDEAAWAQLVALYTPLLRSWLRPHCLQDADTEDLIQEVLVALSQKVRDFHHNKRTGAFRTWLRSIAANKLGDYLRAARRRSAALCDPVALLDKLEDPASDLNRHWEHEHDWHVAQAIMRWIRPDFSDTTWEAFERVVLEGQPTQEVARALGLTPNAVLIAKSRVLARLRLELNAWKES